MQILTWPFAFGITSMIAHHSIGLSTFFITPMSSIFHMSALVLDNNAKGTFLGTVKANGVAFSFSVMEYSPDFVLISLLTLGIVQ